ncbi:MAG: hypothetical protein HQL50_01745 [Magnetococcales bacterium]|nr:hypothetical protein [Magnetococcales bacterium]
MKRRFAVLVITSQRKSVWAHLRRILPFQSLLPQERSRSYHALLTGAGIPFDTLPLSDVTPARIVDGETLHYSAIILTIALDDLPRTLKDTLKKLVEHKGLTLFSDSFITRSREQWALFGIRRRSRLPHLATTIRSRNGTTLYQPRRYPFSSHGRDFGFRPLLRMVVQSWFAYAIDHTPRTKRVALNDRDGAALLSHTVGRGVCYLLNAHPSLLLKEGNRFHTLIQESLCTSPFSLPVTWAFEGLGVLRLDDPGSAERVHLEKFNESMPSEEDWQAVLQVLQKEKSHLNVATVPCWVDDGDTSKGRLFLDDAEQTRRTPGEHHPAWMVRYERYGADFIHDYIGTFSALRQGLEKGLLSILSHGLTHITPDHQRWLAANNRFRKTKWFREFARDCNDLSARIRGSAELIEGYFDTPPTILVPSGHLYTPSTIETCFKEGFSGFSSERLFWPDMPSGANGQCRAIFPHEVLEGMSLIDSGYPLILVLHDYDLSNDAREVMTRIIRTWKERGVRAFIPLETLFLMLSNRMEVWQQEQGSVRVSIDMTHFPLARHTHHDLFFTVGKKPTALLVNGVSQHPLFEPVSGDRYRLAMAANPGKDGTMRMTIHFAEEA